MPDPFGPGRCRSCRAPASAPVLDLGAVPAADDFPLPDAPGPDPAYPLALWVCAACGLAQLERDDTTTAEPLAVEPQALRDQAADAVARVHAWGGLPAVASVAEHGSPHGGSWLPLFEARGWMAVPDRADVVVDTFGLMHEPDVAAALDRRAAGVADDGVLLLLFHSLETILRLLQWPMLRHGHFGYFSTTFLVQSLLPRGLRAVGAWEFDLYGGTVLLAASRDAGPRTGPAAATLDDLLERERSLPDPAGLQAAADAESAALREALAADDRPWYAYGAASRAVAVLHRAGATPDRLRAVADAAPAKQGHAMPGTRIPIVSPEELVAADPERVWLLLPDLEPEVTAAYPALAGRWAVPGQPRPR